MLINVDRKQVIVFENPFRLTADASDLQLSPGSWPEFIAVTDAKGSGFLFRKSHPIGFREELTGYIYQTQSGIQLTVFND